MKNGSFKAFLEECRGHCYIYGAGVYGYYVAKYISANYSESINIDAILVSSSKGNYNNIFGIPVKQINDISNLNEAYIIIAMSSDIASEVKQELNNLGSVNTYIVSEEEYIKIRQDKPDVFAEIRQDISRTSNIVTRKSNDILQMGKYIIKLCELQKEMLSLDLYRYRGRMNDGKRIMKEFQELANTPELLKEKIEKLVSGMDDESVFEVYRIINRCHMLLEDKPIRFSEEEKEKLKKIDEEFNKRIFKLADDLACYKKYFLPKNCFEPVVFYEECGMRYVKSLDYIKGKDIIDAGAYIGDSALVLSKYSSGRVHAFEAQKNNFTLLNKTIELNNAKNIVPVKAALCDREGMLELHLARNTEVNTGASLLGESVSVSQTETELVEATTIDKYVQQNNLKIGLIKTDIEGAEPLLLRGAIETIKTQKPTLLISIYHNMNDFFEIKPWLEKLNLGYKFKVIRCVLDITFINETMLVCEIE